MNLTDMLSAIVLPLIVVIIVLLLVGGLIGWLYSSLRKPPSKKIQESGHRDLVELVRIHRDRRTNALSIAAGEKYYRRRSDLSVNQVDQLSILLGELMEWLGKPELVQRAVDAQMGKTVKLEQGAGDTLNLAQPANEKPRSFLLNPLDALVNAVDSDVPKDVSKPRSIASQIDEILQEKLAELPLGGPPIRLIELPEKGMTVLVGLDQYSGIDEIPDPEVKALIRLSVAEWEKRTKG